MINNRDSMMEDLLDEGLSYYQADRIVRWEAQSVTDHTVYGADLNPYLLTSLQAVYYDLQGVLADMTHLGMGDEVCERTLTRASSLICDMRDAITKYQT